MLPSVEGVLSGLRCAVGDSLVSRSNPVLPGVAGTAVCSPCTPSTQHAHKCYHLLRVNGPTAWLAGRTSENPGS